MGRQLIAHHVVHLRIGGQQVVVERGDGGVGFDLGARRQAVALSDPGHELRQGPSNGAQVRDDIDAPHRARESDGLHRQPLHHSAQADAAPHGVRQQEIGPRQVQAARGAQHGGNVFLIVAENIHMADAGIWQQPVRQTLTAPVNRHGGKAAPREVGGAKAVFFNIFGPPGEQQHRAARPGAGPMTQPDPLAIRCLGPMGLAPFGAGGDIGV